MATDHDKLVSQVTASRDQVWADLIAHYDGICRIARNGPDGSERDTLIVRMVFLAAKGELELRRAGLVT